jgi:hypothetical protein
VDQNPEPFLNKILPDEAKKFLPKVAPFMSMLKLPKPEVMILAIVHKLAELPHEFYLQLEDHLDGIMAGDTESIELLMELLGITDADQS